MDLKSLGSLSDDGGGSDTTDGMDGEDGLFGGEKDAEARCEGGGDVAVDVRPRDTDPLDVGESGDGDAEGVWNVFPIAEMGKVAVSKDCEMEEEEGLCVC